MLTPVRRRDEAGFTLVELLISISILGLIMGAITSAIFVSLDQLSTSRTRLWESNDVRVVASRFSTDVSGGNAFETSKTTTAVSSCGNRKAADTLLEITGATFDPDAPPTDPAAAPTSSYTTYTTAKGTDPGTLVLQRLTCTSGSSGTASTTQVLARGLADGTVAGRAAPSVTCTDAADATVACDAATAVVVKVVLTPASGDTQLTMTLVGRRRTT